MTLAFLALLGAPYIYDISSLRVKVDVYKYLTTVQCYSVFCLLAADSATVTCV